MKLWEYYLTCAMGGLCVLLAAAAGLQARSAGRLQTEIEQGRAEVVQSAMSQQMTGNIVKDIAKLSGTDTELRDLLARHGYATAPAGRSTADSKPASAPRAQ